MANFSLTDSNEALMYNMFLEQQNSFWRAQLCPTIRWKSRYQVAERRHLQFLQFETL